LLFSAFLFLIAWDSSLIMMMIMMMMMMMTKTTTVTKHLRLLC